MYWGGRREGSQAATGKRRVKHATLPSAFGIDLNFLVGQTDDFHEGGGTLPSPGAIPRGTLIAESLPRRRHENWRQSIYLRCTKDRA